jgi:hypothetical protein
MVAKLVDVKVLMKVVKLVDEKVVKMVDEKVV